MGGGEEFQHRESYLCLKNKRGDFKMFRSCLHNPKNTPSPPQKIYY